MIYKCNSCGKRYTKGFESCPSCGGAMYIDSPSKKDDNAPLWINLVALFVPLIGFIMFFVCRKKYPGGAKTVLICALVGFLINVGLMNIGSSGKTSENSTKTYQDNTYIAQSNDQNREVNYTSKTTERALVETVSYEKCSIATMCDELNENALRAEQKYNNMYVEIAGRLGTIDSDGKYIALERLDKEFTFDSVHCSLKNEKQRNQVMEMTKGCTVVLKGRITSVGEIMGYVLDVDEIVNY